MTVSTARRAKRSRRRAKSNLRPEPELLRSNAIGSDSTSQVDRENGVILGYVVAQTGKFKSEGRGQFTTESLEKIVELGNSKVAGLRSRFGHPNQSNDGLGKYLGRARNFRLDGDDKVRADMYLNGTSLEAPPQGGRPLGEYVMHLAETDPGAFSTSLVLSVEEEEIKGQPPVWHPQELFASDVVDVGDAVDDFLSADFLEDIPSGDVYIATKMIDEKFDGLSREVVQARLGAFVDKYLNHKFGEVEPEPEEKEEPMTVDNDRLQKIEDQMAATSGQLSEVTKTMAALNEQISKDREENKLRAASEQRAADITALCAQCGVDSAKATEWIANEKLGINDVKDKLLAMKFESHKPAGDGGGAPDEQKVKDSKFLAEYAENEKLHKSLGVSSEEYVKLRNIEEGNVEDDFDYMSPEWAAKYCEGASK